MDWSQISPLAAVGGPTGGLSDDITTGGLGNVTVLPIQKALHPDHPFFWFAALGAVTFGLIGASTHLRVGPFRADASAGKD